MTWTGNRLPYRLLKGIPLALLTEMDTELAGRLILKSSRGDSMNKYLTIELGDMDIQAQTDVKLCMGIIYPDGEIHIPEQERCEI
jgi:hypothetical protein